MVGREVGRERWVTDLNIQSASGMVYKQALACQIVVLGELFLPDICRSICLRSANSDAVWGLGRV